MSDYFQSIPIVYDDESIDIDSKALIRAFPYESESSLSARLAQMLQKARPPKPKIDLDAVKRRVSEAVAGERYQQQLKDGFAEFQKSYGDIAGNSELFSLADEKTISIAKQNPSWSPAEVMREAGSQVRAWLKSLAEAPDEAEPEQPKRRPAITEDPERVMYGQALADIRKQRGEWAASGVTSTVPAARAETTRSAAPVPASRVPRPTTTTDEDELNAMYFAEIAKARGHD